MLKKLLVDLIMLTIVIILMCISVTGSFTHELLGIIIFIIIIIHLLLNFKIIKSIFTKFKNMPGKNKINFTLDIIIGINLLVIIITGIFISQNFFTFIKTNNIPLWSSIHHFSSYLEICLMGIHLGFHLPTIIKYLEIKLKYKDLKFKNVAYSLMSLALMGSGLYNMVKPAFYNNFTFDNLNNTDSASADETDNVVDPVTTEIDDEDTSDQVSSSIQDSVSTKVTLNDYLKDKHCNGCSRHCSLASPLCNRSASYIEAATAEYNSIYGVSATVTNSSGTNAQQLSTKETLEKYLSKLHCTGCHNNCALSNIRCNVGVVAVENATKEYNKLYSASQTVEIENDNINLFGYLSIISFFALGTHYTIKLVQKKDKQS